MTVGSEGRRDGCEVKRFKYLHNYLDNGRGGNLEQSDVRIRIRPALHPTPVVSSHWSVIAAPSLDTGGRMRGLGKNLRS